jgi:CubicO group peptidase (beta-lactamase class C family)
MSFSTRSQASWRPLVLACSLVIYPAIAWAWQADAPAVQRLVTAARHGEVETVKQLLDEGADLNATLPSGLTALHAARIRGHDDVAQLLLKRGADEKISLPPLEKLVDSLIADRLPDGSPGVAVLVARDHEVLLKRGYGYASLEHSVPVSPSTRFRIGSVTKQFTAVAILQLVEQGKLKLEDPLSRFIPDFPQGDNVTIQQLLTHTSGIRSYTDKPDFLSGVTKEVSPTELIESFKNEPYDFSPGEGWHYNNSGYFLLGFIIAQVSGDSYAEYLRKHMFEPLEMNDTGIHDAT